MPVEGCFQGGDSVYTNNWLGHWLGRRHAKDIREQGDVIDLDVLTNQRFPPMRRVVIDSWGPAKDDHGSVLVKKSVVFLLTDPRMS